MARINTDANKVTRGRSDSGSGWGEAGKKSHARREQEAGHDRPAAAADGVNGAGSGARTRSPDHVPLREADPRLSPRRLRPDSPEETLRAETSDCGSLDPDKGPGNWGLCGRKCSGKSPAVRAHPFRRLNSRWRGQEVHLLIPYIFPVEVRKNWLRNSKSDCVQRDNSEPATAYPLTRSCHTMNGRDRMEPIVILARG
jgi:hypothetical protein